MALEIAERIGGEIVSVDSMQVYRGMDIGTAKASRAMRAEVQHHLLDLVDPEEDFPVARFQRMGRASLDDIERRQRVPVICGGSGLHFRSLVDPLVFPPSDSAIRAELEALDHAAARNRLEAIDPAVAAHVDLANPRRVVRALEIAEITGLTPSQRAATEEATAVRDYRPRRHFVAVGLDPGEELPGRVEARFDAMLDRGLLDEVAGLRHRLGRLAGQAVGYKELLPVVAGEKTLDQGRAAAIRATLALAKRQRTFFRRDPRIRWITWNRDATALTLRAQEYLDEVTS